MYKSKYKPNKIYYFWACDYSKISGEGILGNLFIKNFQSDQKISKVFTVRSLNIKNKKIKKILNYKYISPFVGIIFCWYFFLNGRRVGYINYLPLWNFVLFLALPPKITLGPITGGAKFDKKHQFIIRKYFFFIFYKISELIIFIRCKKVTFATDLLKNILNKYTIFNSKFNFVFKKININKKIKKKQKKIDFLIYYKDHRNKNIVFPFELLKKLIRLNFKIFVFGDRLKMIGIKNLGYLNNNKINSLLSKTRYTISSNENFYTMFNLECINNKVKIITTERKQNIKYFKDSYIYVNENKEINLKRFLK